MIICKAQEREIYQKESLLCKPKCLFVQLFKKHQSQNAKVDRTTHSFFPPVFKKEISNCNFKSKKRNKCHADDCGVFKMNNIANKILPSKENSSK